MAKRIHGVRGSKYHSKAIKRHRRVAKEQAAREARIAQRKAARANPAIN